MRNPLEINAQQYKRLNFCEAKLRACFATLLAANEYPFPTGEISLVFLSDSDIAELHATYLDDPTPTDVITFPGDPEMDFAGEICVSVDHALTACAEHGTPFAEELTLYIVHGYLHLAGLNDKNEQQRAQMRLAEADMLNRLKQEETLPDFSFS